MGAKFGTVDATLDRFWPRMLDAETRSLLARRAERPGLGDRPALIAIDLYDLAYAGGARYLYAQESAPLDDPAVKPWLGPLLLKESGFRVHALKPAERR